jgi:hypothetical protein
MFFFFGYSAEENQLSTRFLQSQSRNAFYFCDIELIEDPKLFFGTNVVYELTMVVMRWNLNLKDSNLLVIEKDCDSSLRI